MCAIHFLYVFDGMFLIGTIAEYFFSLLWVGGANLRAQLLALWDREYNAPGNTHNIHLSWRRGDVRPALPDLTSELEGGQRGGI